MIQTIQIAGALLLLAAFGALQLGRLTPERLSYQLLNLTGAVVLAVVAAIEERWGFLLLEVVWALATLPPLARIVQAQSSQA